MNSVKSRSRYVKYQVRCKFVDVSGRKIETICLVDVEDEHPDHEYYAREYVAQMLVSLGFSGVEIKSCHYHDGKPNRTGECEMCDGKGYVTYDGIDGEPVVMGCYSCSVPKTQQELFDEFRQHIPKEDFDQAGSDLEKAFAE